MKTYCEKCHYDLSKEVHSAFEEFEVGRIQCPKCKKKQKRYISETDLLLYFAVSALIYVALFTLIFMLFASKTFDYKVWIALALIFIVGFILMKAIGPLIYKNAYFKKQYKETVLEEAKEEIRKRMRWQFIMFMLCALFVGTQAGSEMPLIVMLVLFVIIVGIKMYLCLKNEKEAYLKAQSKDA